MSTARPLIGITMRHDLQGERLYLSRHYSEAVLEAGGAPIHLPLIPRTDYIETVMEHLDGVLLPGSASDVDPALYGREPQAYLGSVHPLRDETDAIVLKYMENNEMPLLAICYGMQAWNVQKGGSLIQDIKSEVAGAIKHEQGEPRDRSSHRISLQDESILRGLSEGGTQWVNSHHHQAVENLGDGLRAAAWTSDGLVEGIETDSGEAWRVGVQWHPELNWEWDVFSKRLFEAFVSAAKNYREKRDV